PNARNAHPQLGYATAVAQAAEDASIVALLTEWPEFAQLHPEDLSDVVAGRNIIDARNALDPTRWREAGWTYRALGMGAGRPAPHPEAGLEGADYKMTPQR